MSKSLLYAVNSNTQTFSVDGTVNFGSTVRRFGCNCFLNNGNTELRGAGFYSTDADFDIEGTAAGSVTIELLLDGTLIPGATATITTADGDFYSVSISAVSRNMCCGTHTLTALVSGVGCSISSATIRVEKS